MIAVELELVPKTVDLISIADKLKAFLDAYGMSLPLGLLPPEMDAIKEVYDFYISIAHLSLDQRLPKARDIDDASVKINAFLAMHGGM